MAKRILLVIATAWLCHLVNDVNTALVSQTKSPRTDSLNCNYSPSQCIAAAADENDIRFADECYVEEILEKRVIKACSETCAPGDSFAGIGEDECQHWCPGFKNFNKLCDATTTTTTPTTTTTTHSTISTITVSRPPATNSSPVQSATPVSTVRDNCLQVKLGLGISLGLLGLVSLIAMSICLLARYKNVTAKNSEGIGM